MPPSPQLNSRQAKHLEFRAAPVPKFLQAFKDKVQPEPTAGSEFDGLLGKGSSSSAKDDGLFPDSEDEADWEGAHVVVLNDKKHLTLEQAREFSKAEPSPDGACFMIPSCFVISARLTERLDYIQMYIPPTKVGNRMKELHKPACQVLQPETNAAPFL